MKLKWISPVGSIEPRWRLEGETTTSKLLEFPVGVYLYTAKLDRTDINLYAYFLPFIGTITPRLIVENIPGNNESINRSDEEMDKAKNTN